MALSLSGEEHLLPNKNLVLDGVAKVPQDPRDPWSLAALASTSRAYLNIFGVCTR
jgi:hypothetical protein